MYIYIYQYIYIYINIYIYIYIYSYIARTPQPPSEWGSRGLPEVTSPKGEGI